MTSRVLRLFRPYRGRVALLAATIVLGSALGVAAPVLTQAVFDDALFPKDGDPRVGLLALLVGLIALAVALSAAAGFLQTYLASVIGQLVMHDLRDRLYRHLQLMSLRFFTDTRTGEIQSRILNDVGGVEQVVAQGAVKVLANGVFIVASFTAMAFLAWQLALLALVMVPLFAYAAFRVGRARRDLSAAAQETLADMSSITEETLSVAGALHGKVFGRERAASDRYREQSRRLAELKVREEMVGRLFLGLAQAFFLVSPAIVYLAAGVAMSGGTGFTAGTLVAFTALQARLFVPVRELLETSLQMQSAAALFERIFHYLDLPHEIVDSPGARRLPRERCRGAVGFRGVHFSYEGGGDRWTLEDISFEVQPGQLAALVGPSGAGKTTTSYLVARLYDVDRGSVTIDGIDVREIRLGSLADLVGIVTQDTHVFHASVRDNLLYARPEAAPEEVEAAARLAFIHDRILELPAGYDTVVGERGYRMSGGEKQRLAIARAILKDPRILILDEATSALDTGSERLVQRGLQPLIAERTTIAIAHRLSTILAADVIFVLDRGRLVERGSHSGLVAAGGLYARLYEEQFASGEVEARCEDGVVLATGAVATARSPLG